METWSNLCRCCLCPDSEIAILSENEENVKQKFLETTSIEVKSDDGLPQKLCSDCFSALTSAYNFRQQCIKMDTDLKSQLQALLAKEYSSQQDMIEIQEHSSESFKQLQSIIKAEPSDSDDDYYYVLVIDDKDKVNIPQEVTDNNADLPEIRIKLEGVDDHGHEPETEQECELDPAASLPNSQHEPQHIDPEPRPQDTFENSIESFIIDNTKVPDNVPATILESEEESQDCELISQVEANQESENPEMEIDYNQDSNSQIQNWVELQTDQNMDGVQDIESINAVNSLLQNIPNSQSSIIKILSSSGKDGPILLRSGNNVTYLAQDVDPLIEGQESKVIICDGDENSQFQIVKCPNGSELVIEYADADDGDNEQIATVLQQEDGTFLCECGESFKEISDYEVHQSTHNYSTDQDDNVCTLCGKCFESPEILTGHLFLHNVTGLVVNCPFCFQSFKRNTLTQHIKYSHNNIKPTCKICEKTFANPNNLKRHMTIHTGQKEFACNICYKRFSQKITMQTHRLTHINVYDCRLCDKSFDKKSLLDEHKTSGTCAKTKIPDVKKELMQTVKQEMKSQNGKTLGYACSLCKRMFSQEKALEEHVESMHMGSEEELLCSECGDIRVSRKDLITHMNEHKCLKKGGTGKRFECTSCGKNCSSQAMLIMHERVHTNERPYPCQLCSLRFKTKTHLRTHQLTHTREKKFGCSICMKFFALKGNLVVHLRTHTGERPYVCNLCEESFIDSKYLKKHKLKKHSIYRTDGEKMLELDSFDVRI